MTFNRRTAIIASVSITIVIAGLVSAINPFDADFIALTSEAISTNMIVLDTDNGVSFFLAPDMILREAEASDRADTFYLTDEAGNWFKSENTGTPVTIIHQGESVKFDLHDKTDVPHTVTLLVQPTDSEITAFVPKADMEKGSGGTVELEFEEPGAYLFVCKIHPYMTGIVAVTDSDKKIPDVTPEMLPAIGALGLPSLPATTVVSLLTTIAPDTNPNGLEFIGTKATKWEFLQGNNVKPTISGVGEVWINTQHETVPGQETDSGLKPGSITVVDVDSVSTFGNIKQEINGLDEDAIGMWNNPHNMWPNVENTKVYNGNWFGQWLQKIDRASGDVETSLDVGDAPTHIVTIMDKGDDFGKLTLPLSGKKVMLKIEDKGDELKIVDKFETGSGHNHPHGQWLSSDGKTAIVPNVFQGFGIAGSISKIDTTTGDVEFEITDDSIALPVAAGIANNKAYVANIATGTLSIIDMETEDLVTLPVTTCPLGTINDPSFSCGTDVTDVLTTLRLPIQTPPSPDGQFVATAIFSLTSVVDTLDLDENGEPDFPGAADQIVIVNTDDNTIEAALDCPAGCHGINWGAKQGGGYYAYVTSQHSNILTVVDPDVNGDGHAEDAVIVGRISLANGSIDAGVTDGTGGEGVLPLPLVKDGWIQQTVIACKTTDCGKVDNWLGTLTDDQKFE